MSHGDQLQSLPPNFKVVAHTPTSPWTAVAHESKPIYGVQFHPEVSHSPKGKEVIAGFVKNICGIKGGWSMVSPLSSVMKEGGEEDRNIDMVVGLVHPQRDC